METFSNLREPHRVPRHVLQSHKLIPLFLPHCALLVTVTGIPAWPELLTQCGICYTFVYENHHRGWCHFSQLCPPYNSNGCLHLIWASYTVRYYSSLFMAVSTVSNCIFQIFFRIQVHCAIFRLLLFIASFLNVRWRGVFFDDCFSLQIFDELANNANNALVDCCFFLCTA